MILVIDNYDSFTYNLVQYVGKHTADIRVARNDKITIAEIAEIAPAAIVISPGPKTPLEAGVSCAVIEAFYKNIPILGVCLGHQSMGQVFGGKIERAPAPMHGKISSITHDGAGVYAGLPSPFDVVRYHSLIIDRASCPAELIITAESNDGLIMGVRHRDYPKMEGVQFHPESIKTDHGPQIIENFLKIAGVI